MSIFITIVKNKTTTKFKKQQLDREQQMDSEQQMLQSTDKIAEIVSLHLMKTIVNAKNKMDETPLHTAVKYGKSS